MSNMLYQLVLPTSVEPQNGWTASDRCVFIVNHENQQMRPGTFRLNGVLNLSRVENGTSTPITTADQLMLNPNAGISAFIRQIQTKFGSSTVETINEFGRFVALKNENRYYQVDNATSTDSMLELMTYSNNADVTGTDLKINVTQGMKFPIDNSTTASELPFSLDLDICLNNSVDPLPYSRTGQIEVAIIFQDNNKCGMKCANIESGVSYTYSIKNLETRFIADPEQEHKGGIILETKCLSHNPTILNRISALEFAPSNEFDSVVCGFLKQGHDSTNTSFNYDYLASEAITEQIEYLEVKINGQDYNKGLKYPLRFQTSEILYNFLCAWRPLIHGDEDTSVTKHGLSYVKLGNGEPQNTIPTGFGIGCRFMDGIAAGNKVCFNISLKSNPNPITPYRCYFYTIGKLII